MPTPIQKLLRHPLLALALFCAVALAVYSPALAGGKIWDDDYLVGENPFFRSPVFALETFRHFLFFESNSTYYRPVQNLSYMADYWLWGGGTTGFHITNVLLHSLAAWLISQLLARLLKPMAGDKAEPLAFAISAVWLVHPIHNAAVAYISGRADSLAAVFCAGAWLLWLHARTWRRAPAIAGTLAACILLLLGLCSKEIALMWTVLFLLHAVAFERLPWRKIAAVLATLGAVVCVYTILRALPAPRPGSALEAESFLSRVVLALRALGDYAGLVFFPNTLLMERSLTRGRSDYLPLVGAFTLAAFIWLCARRSESASMRRFGAAWFFVAFIPISNLIPLNADVAEHWIYLASIGFLVFVGSLLINVRGAAILTSVAVCAFATRTWFRAHDWTDAGRFAQKTIQSGGTTPRLLSYYANILGNRGDYKAQEEILRRMLTVFPQFTIARANLGICLVKQGRKDEAEPFFSAAKADAPSSPGTVEAPRSWGAALSLAKMRLDEKRPAEALALAREWRGRFPRTWELAAMESFALEALGQDAIAPVTTFIGDQWWHRPAHMHLATLFLAAGNRDKAVAILENTARLDIRDPVPHMEIARIEAARNRPAEAAQAIEKAIARAPESPEPHMLLAGILHQYGRTQEANAALAQAATLKSRSE
jgi:protein O-mannosyl-transferase